MVSLLAAAERESQLRSVSHRRAWLAERRWPQDRATVDEYLDNIREVERRIQLAGKQLDADLDLPAAPTGIPSSYEA